MRLLLNTLKMAALRGRVLSSFKKLHRTRKVVFDGDVNAMAVIRDKINKEFRDRVGETDPAAIEEMIKIAEDSEKLLRTTVVQEVQKNEDTFTLKLREDNKIMFTENAPFDPDAEIPTSRRKSKKCDDAAS